MASLITFEPESLGDSHQVITGDTEAVAPAESPLGRNAVNSPAAMGKSQRVLSRAAAAVADIGQGGGKPAAPTPQNHQGRTLDGDDDAGSPGAPDDADAIVKNPVALPQNLPT